VDSKYVVTFYPLRPGHVIRRMRNTIFGVNSAEQCIWQIDLNNSKHLTFGTLHNIIKREQQKDKVSVKLAWPRSCDPYDL